MKYLIYLSLAIVLSSTNASAQGLFDKLKKAATEKVNSAVNKKVNKAEENIVAGFVGNNPFKDVWQIDEIKAYGTKTSENFGKVWLVIKAQAIVPLEYGTVGLGGSLFKTYAIIDGKTYKPTGDVEKGFEMPEGVPMEIDTKNVDAIYIKNVPVSTTEIQAYNMYIYIDGGRHKTVLWKHIPIIWTEQ